MRVRERSVEVDAPAVPAQVDEGLPGPSLGPGAMRGVDHSYPTRLLDLRADASGALGVAAVEQIDGADAGTPAPRRVVVDSAGPSVRHGGEKVEEELPLHVGDAREAVVDVLVILLSVLRRAPGIEKDAFGSSVSSNGPRVSAGSKVDGAAFYGGRFPSRSQSLSPSDLSRFNLKRGVVFLFSDASRHLEGPQIDDRESEPAREVVEKVGVRRAVVPIAQGICAGEEASIPKSRGASSEVPRAPARVLSKARAPL